MGGSHGYGAGQTDGPWRPLVRPSLVSLGDLLRVYHALRVTPKHRADVVACLGLEVTGPASTETADAPSNPTSSSATVASEDATVPASHGRSGWEATENPALLSWLQPPLPREDAPLPPWLLSSPTIGRDPVAGVRKVDPEPLFAPNWTRGILEALVGSPSDDGPVDAAAAVAILARREPLHAVPRLAHTTLGRGAQILVDAGDGLVPFTRDQARLVADLKRVIGSTSLEILRFAGTPLRGAGIGGRRHWEPWQPPARPKPIVLLTDLGIAQPPAGERVTSTECAPLPSVPTARDALLLRLCRTPLIACRRC